MKDQRSMDKNKTRKGIKDLLRDRNCITFVRPVMDESKLSRIEEMSYNDLRPDFRKSVAEFLNTTQMNLKPKMINGKGISGKMFVELAQLYIDAFNKGGCPEILPSLDRVISQEVNSLVLSHSRVFSDILIKKLKDNSASQDMRDNLSIYESVVSDLESELWTNSQKKQNSDFFWMPKQRIVKDLREILDRFLDSQQEKKRALNDKIKSKFAQSLVPPKRSNLETYFSSQRIKEYHMGMLNWLEKALDKGMLSLIKKT